MPREFKVLDVSDGSVLFQAVVRVKRENAPDEFVPSGEPPIERECTNPAALDGWRERAATGEVVHLDT